MTSYKCANNLIKKYNHTEYLKGTIPTNNGDSSLKCRHCYKVFDKKSNFIRHLKRKNPCHKGNPNLKCQYCHKQYSRKDSMNRHKKKMHTDIINNNNNNNNNSGIIGNDNTVTINNINQYFLLPSQMHYIDDLKIIEPIKK